MRTSSAARQFVAWVPLVALSLLLPALAAAQEPVKSFDQLNTRLKLGDTVWVTDAQGREIKGRLTSFAPDAVGVDANGAQVLRADEVRAVEHRRPDSLANGALIGLGVGFATGAGLALWACSEEECSWGEATMFALVIAGVGTGIGVGVDALIPGRKQVVYRAPGASGNARLSIAPVITPRTKGFAVSFAF
jgi:hypothetical protein